MSQPPLPNRYSNFSSIQTYNETGAVDFTPLIDEYDEAYALVEQDAGYLLSDNLQDRSMRSGLDLAGWKPRQNKAAQAVEWLVFDFETAYTPVGGPEGGGEGGGGGNELVCQG